MNGHQRLSSAPTQWLIVCVRVRRFILPVDETTSNIDTLQSDILDIIGRSSIITPDDLRGNASTLQEALVGSGG